MCGIVGFTNNKLTSIDSKNLINEMALSLQHRGPDDQGYWVHNNNLLSFGHRRLSIFDLSRLGKQPMVSKSNRYIISYNGEIYNFKEIKKELIEKGHSFISSSDTEVLLSSIEEWGVKNALKKFIGMFAFSLWDEKKQILSLVRDRFGEKPLYYGWQGNIFLFASELKALKKHHAWSGDIDQSSLGYFVKFGYVPTPLSIYENINKLNPGCIFQLQHKNDKWVSLGEEVWWDRKNSFTSSKYDSNEIEFKVENLLNDSINIQSLADVSVGSFLSGGIDSSLITALMQSNSTKKIKTFTIGFREADYDESSYASKVANYLGTDHHEYSVSPSDALELIPSLPKIYDEPFADSSQIPTLLLSRFTKTHVSVALSGDGGDEIFSGYNRYMWAPKFYNLSNKFPIILKNLLSYSSGKLSVAQVSLFYRLVENFIPSKYRVVGPVEKFQKIRKIISKENEFEIYDTLSSIWSDDNPVNSFTDVTYLNRKSYFDSCGNSFVKKMMKADISSFLLDDILVKVDRAAMSHSLETRMPFLDHRIYEYTNEIPIEMHANNGKSKMLLRNILKKYLPSNLIDRPKAGFGVPISSWLRGSLKNWTYDSLNFNKIKNEGFLDPNIITEYVKQHMNKEYNRQHELWNILMWQNWFDNEK